MMRRALVGALLAGVAVVSLSGPVAAFEKEGGRAILVWGGRTPISNFDPHQRFDSPHHVFQSALYEPLVKYEGTSAKIIPWLADSWEMSADAKTWTFKLNKNAKFQNGDPVDAEAVRYSFERNLKIKKGVSWMLEGVLAPDGIKVIDKQTVAFTLSQPYPSFIGFVPWWMIVNPKQIAGNEVDGDLGQKWMMTNAVGSGPYRVKRFEADASFQLEAKADYWKGWPQGEEKRLAGVIYRVIREPSAQRTALMTRSADIVEGLTTADYEQLARVPGIVVANNPGASPFAIKFNYQKGPTVDGNLRRAIAFAFDYNSLASLYAGDAKLMTSPFTSVVKGHIDVEGFPKQDLAKAKEFLAKTQWPNGGLELDYVYQQGNDETRRVGLILLNSLKPLNITVNLKPTLWANMVANSQSPDTAANMTGLFTSSYSVDPDASAFQYHKASWGQWFGVSHYNSPEVFALMEKARSTPEWSQREPLYVEIQKRLTEDQPEVFGYVPNVRIAFRDYVKGYSFNAMEMQGFADFGALWIEQ